LISLLSLSTLIRRLRQLRRHLLTFFVTSAGPGKGADSAALKAPTSIVSNWRNATPREEKLGARI
jgi:hypothetical protein